jgi:hypothetical protein
MPPRRTLISDRYFQVRPATRPRITSCKPMLEVALAINVRYALSLDSPNQLECLDFLSDVLELLGSDAFNEVLVQEPILRR